jgi:hypothetical protein
MQRSGIWITVVLMLGGIGVARASGQSPDPTRPWSQTVHELADAIVGAGDNDALAGVLPAGVPIRRFDRSDREDRLSLRSITAGAAVVACLSYESAPTTVASDLSAHLAEAAFIPESIRLEFAVPAGAGGKRANDIASQWVMGTLQPGVQQPVAIIVLWRERPVGTSTQQPQGTLVFILIKGREISPDDYRTSLLVYGTTAQVVREKQ